MSIHFSSQRMNWKTPKAFYENLNLEFGFDFDPCPADPTFDGLNCAWGGVTFCNPPYGRELSKWIKKGFKEWGVGKKTVVFLIPARPDTKVWHEIILPYATEIRFIKGRLKFDDQKNSAPFPSCLVIFLSQSRELVK